MRVMVIRMVLREFLMQDYTESPSSFVWQIFGLLIYDNNNVRLSNDTVFY